MNYLFDPQPTVSAAIAGTTTRFPVHRIYCVGRNYAAHIREMGLDPSREPPFFFLKPADALVDSDAVIPYPSDTADFQHEIELVVAIGKGGSDIPVEQALEHVFGYGVGIDLTRRDRQTEARDKGRPWERGKAFDRSAPLAPLHPAEQVGHLSSGRIWLTVNGKPRQESDIDQLVWSVPEIVAILSRGWELQPGDVIFSGTPAGIGPLQPGDDIAGGITGLSDLRVTIAP